MVQNMQKSLINKWFLTKVSFYMSCWKVVVMFVASLNYVQDMKAIGINKNGFLLRLNAAIKQLPTVLYESRMPVRLTQHDITPHHTTPHHTTPDHTTPHHT